MWRRTDDIPDHVNHDQEDNNGREPGMNAERTVYNGQDDRYSDRDSNRSRPAASPPRGRVAIAVLVRYHHIQSIAKDCPKSNP